MVKNFLLITVRGMMKNKLFIFINVFGMGLAIACAIVAYLAHDYDATFDNVHQNRNAVYRVSGVRVFENTETRFGYAPLPLGEIVDKTMTDVSKSSRHFYSWSNFRLEDNLFESNLTYVDPDFFEIFSFQFLSGSPKAMEDNTSVLLSETMATRLFGAADAALGKSITQVFGNSKKELKVAGVFSEQPANSSFYKRSGSAYMNFEGFKDEHTDLKVDDWRQECSLFVQIPESTRVAGVTQQLQQYVVNNNKVRDESQLKEYVLDPLSTMAHDDRTGSVRAATWGAPPIAAITGSVIMAVLLVLIACFNLTNTAIAISSRRLKEIGIRKVMGSMRIQLVIQFIGETTFICLLALIVAVGLTDLLITGWNIMSDNNIYLSHQYFNNTSFLLFLICVLFGTGVVAGSYPAFYISKFQPVNVLKGKLKFGGSTYFTRTLLVLQFTFSLIAIVNSIVFLQNARYQRTYDLGFDIQGAVIASVKDKQEFDTYRNSLSSNPDILSMAGAKSGIFSNRLHEPVKHESRQVEADIIEVGDNYLNTMGLTLLEGRDFIKDSQLDQQESVIITERMAKLFGWEDPLGKELLWKDTSRLFVVGVVKDVYTMGLWKEMEPMIIRYIPSDQYNQIIVRTKAENVSKLDGFMKERWGSVIPNRLYNGRMLISELQTVVDLNLSIMYSYAFLALIAMMLSATGLFTLLSLNIIKRMKEIGVRKVLGASVTNIARIVNTEFVIILLVASALGSFASYNMSSAILGSIWKYYQSANVTTLIVSVGLLLTISFITIGYKVLTISTMNPVNTLRDE